MAKFVKVRPSETVDAIQVKEAYAPVQVGSWIVNDGYHQYIISDREFQQRFRRVEG